MGRKAVKILQIDVEKINDDGKQFMAVLWRSFNVVISSLNYQLLIVPQIKRKDHDFGDVCSCVKLGLKLFWSRST